MPDSRLVDEALLRDWPLPDLGSDKEERGRLVVVAGSRRDARCRPAVGRGGPPRRRRQDPARDRTVVRPRPRRHGARADGHRGGRGRRRVAAPRRSRRAGRPRGRQHGAARPRFHGPRRVRQLVRRLRAQARGHGRDRRAGDGVRHRQPRGGRRARRDRRAHGQPRRAGALPRPHRRRGLGGPGGSRVPARGANARGRRVRWPRQDRRPPGRGAARRGRQPRARDGGVGDVQAGIGLVWWPAEPSPRKQPCGAPGCTPPQAIASPRRWDRSATWPASCPASPPASWPSWATDHRSRLGSNADAAVSPHRSHSKGNDRGGRPWEAS